LRVDGAGGDGDAGRTRPGLHADPTPRSSRWRVRPRRPFAFAQTKSAPDAGDTPVKSLGVVTVIWAWWINMNHTDSEGQPLTFPTRLVGSGTPGTTGTPVNGAALDANNAHQPWFVLGTGTQYDTRQDHLKIKLAYDISSTLRASYVLGVWHNSSDGNSTSAAQLLGRAEVRLVMDIHTLSFTIPHHGVRSMTIEGDLR